METTKPKTRAIHFAGREIVPYCDEHRRSASAKAKADGDAVASLVPVAAAFSTASDAAAGV